MYSPCIDHSPGNDLAGSGLSLHHYRRQRKNLRRPTETARITPLDQFRLKHLVLRAQANNGLHFGGGIADN
jgi:hypothetical protein